jgi:hypothetical protein
MISQGVYKSAETPVLMSVNYLYYGKASQMLGVLLETHDNFVLRNDRNIQPCANQTISNECEDIINFFSISPGVVPRHCIMEGLSKTKHWRRLFRSIGCRGFSFSLNQSPLPYQRLRLDLECFALVVDDCFYYPPKVRGALHELNTADTHLTKTIGWVLFKEILCSNARYWVVLNIQSDWASRGPSCIRDHFRGWQRVLIYCLLVLAQDSNISGVAIPHASTVVRASKPLRPETNASQHWLALYDGTAEALDMKVSRLPTEVDIQTIVHLPPVMSSLFFTREFEPDRS